MDHPVIVLFVVIAVVASMGLAAEVLKPLALSVLLAFALTPFARFFERWGLSRGAGAPAAGASGGPAAEVPKPVARSVLLAFALTPFARFFERWGLSRVPAVLV